MKGENEFVYFLVAGLVIIAVMLAAFSMNITGSSCPSCKNTTQGIIEVVKTFDIPQIEASNVFQTRESGITDKTVYNGLLFGSDSIKYDLNMPYLQDVELRFSVASTNHYGKLIVLVNGKMVEGRYFDTGDYTVEVPADAVSDRMVIEVYAENSGWRIWAPALYELKDVSVSYTSYFAKTSQYKFYLGEEYMTMMFSKVDMVLTQNVGTLYVDINGQNVWASPAANQQSVILGKNDLRLGDNIVTFRAAKDSDISGYGTIVVIYQSKFPELINRTGIVTAVQPLTGVSSQFYA